MTDDWEEAITINNIKEQAEAYKELLNNILMYCQMLQDTNGEDSRAYEIADYIFSLSKQSLSDPNP